jgi:BNR repeat-containing family member
MWRRVAALGVVAALGLAAAPAHGAERTLGQGAWSWFGDPRAVTHTGEHTRTYVGWVSGDGSIVVASYDHNSREQVTSVLHDQLQRDDHAVPALMVRPDGHIVAFYSRHTATPMYYRVSTSPEDVSSWGPAQTIPTNVAGNRGYTYPNPMRLASEGKTYLFWRGGNYNPTFSTQEDEQTTWSQAQNLIFVQGHRPYVKYDSNGRDTIHFAFTQGHPDSFNGTNIYYARYRAGKIERADGTQIGTLGSPIAPADADEVFDEVAEAWIHDIALDGAGRPVVVFASFPTTTDHRYHYARWTGSAWETHEIVAAGGSISSDGRQPYYSGGITLDHEDPSRVYLSRQEGNAWEVEVWTTSDGGATWLRQAVTSGSGQVKNVRPISPRGMVPFDADLSLIWMRGAYDSYLLYQTSIEAILASPPEPPPPSPSSPAVSQTPGSTGAQPGPPQRKRAAARLRFSSRLIRLDRRGRGRLRIRCLAAPGDRCRVTGLLRRGARVGVFSGNVPGGRVGGLRLRLTPMGLARLRRARQLRAIAVASSTNGAGERVRGVRKVGLRLARP